MFRYTRPVRDVLVDAPHNERLTLLAIDRARARLLGPLNAVQILLLQAGVHVQVQLLILPLRRHGNMLGRRARYGRLGNDMHFMHISTISCHITGHNRNSYELLKLPES